MSNELKVVSFTELENETLTNVEHDMLKECLTFTCASGNVYEMFHTQDCCESVGIVDRGATLAELMELVGQPIVSAYTTTSNGSDEPAPDGFYADDSVTWTFLHVTY